jgi:N12 class adenine-specific DNA methylase
MEITKKEWLEDSFLPEDEEPISFSMDMDFSNVFNETPEVKEIEGTTSSDGLILSLTTLGYVDIEYISKITNKTLEDVINDLKGSIFQNPLTWEETFYKGWETKEEYLSGNLRIKYKLAEEANKLYGGIFTPNLDAINKITNDSANITIDEIYFTLGSPWIPEEVIKEFVSYVLGWGSDQISVKHDPVSGTWDVSSTNDFMKYSFAYEKYSTDRVPFFRILEKTLNQNPIVVYDSKRKNSYYEEEKSSAIRNEEETFLALEKQRKIIKEFKEWVYGNEKIKVTLENIYNEQFCQNYQRYFPGEILTFPGMSKDITLFDYQKDAVARIIFSKNTLLAHDVGSGKTYEMVAAAQELKRMKISKKNLFVVPNSIINQWKKIYLEMYPTAKLLIVDKRNFTPGKRESTLKLIKENEYDSIIMSYSSFDMIELSPDFYKDKIERDFAQNRNASQNDKTSTKQVKNKANNVKAYTKKIEAIGQRDPDRIYFEDLEIDRLFVDESHNFKNVTLETEIRIMGVNTIGSKKCNTMMDKVKYVQKTHNGGGVVFATATPITNSIADIFVIQKYLQEGELKVLNLTSFPAWLANFAEMQQGFEIDIDTSKFRMANRYSKFHNIPELASVLSNIIDFHHMDKDEDLPEFNGYTDIVTQPDKQFKEFLQDISSRADDIRNRRPRLIVDGPTKADKLYDNMLMITNDGRKAALDLRLVDVNAKYNYDYKVNACAREVYKIYQETESFKGTQLIFCDVSTPKNSFNIYDEMKRVLINLGIKENEIQFIHDFESASSKEKLFKAVNSGEVRVLLGSTFKLGTGVNVQERLYAIHHIDVPWRPSDIIQRNGRIIRLGNTNKEVFIFRYILKNSFDAYSWQLLETKQNFIHKLLNNNVFVRDASDIDDVTLNYAEVKALAIGEPLLKERVETYNELQNLKKLRFNMLENKEKTKVKMYAIETNLPTVKRELSNAELDLIYIKTLNLDSIDEEEKKLFRESVFASLLVNIDKREEEKIEEYFGFNVLSPSYQPHGEESMFLYLEHVGKYYLKVGRSSYTIMKRIEDFIKNFENYVNELKLALETDISYLENARIELEKEDIYLDKINRVQERLDEIDKKLGVKKGGK